MQDRDGSFITMKYRFANYRIKSLRWAQALNCRALCRYILYRGLSPGSPDRKAGTECEVA